MVGSDGLMSKGQGHPRAAGSFPKFLATFCREGSVNLYDAVAKITALPAARLRLENKGRLNAGADADITIFDFQKIRDGATFAEPSLAPEGIDYVIIGGEIAAENCRIVKNNCGKSVRN